MNEAIFTRVDERGFLTKSIGIQALFDFLKEIAPDAIRSKDISADFFRKYFDKMKSVDFTKANFPANAQGRALIRNFLFYANGITTKRSIKQEDQEKYDTLLQEEG